MSDTSKWTSDRLEHYVLLCRAAHRLHGNSGGYFRSMAMQLPADLPVELLAPLLKEAGLPPLVEPVEDPRYVGLARIADA